MVAVLDPSTGARVQPPQDPGQPEGKTASMDDLEREIRKEYYRWKIEKRKRLIFFGLHRKPIKLWDKFALFMEATGAFPVSRGSEDTERLLVQVLETWADKWTQGASMLQGISLKKESKREKKRKKKHTRWPSFFKRGPLFLFSKGSFIPLLVHRGKWKMQSHTESAQTLHLFCLYRNQDFFCKPFP